MMLVGVVRQDGAFESDCVSDDRCGKKAMVGKSIIGGCMANDKQVIFSLIGVGRVHPPKKQVLKDIYLSFYYGAKIGVLGLNGSGKSTLLRIIAGVDKDYIGEMTMSKGYTVGLLEQEPQLDKGKTVK